MEKGVFLGTPENPILVGRDDFFFAVAIMGGIKLTVF
jgi:hypothetical protein